MTQLLEAAHLDPDEPVEVSTNGRGIVISPVRAKREVSGVLGAITPTR